MIIVLASLMSISAFANSLNTYNDSDPSVNEICEQLWEIAGTKELKLGLDEDFIRCYVNWKLVALESTTNTSVGKISIWVNHRNYSTYTFVNGKLTSWTER